MRQHLLVYINGQPRRVAPADAMTPLSEYLRRRRGLTGTKVVCAEGDCGSCAALVGRVTDGKIQYTPVTSCIVRMIQLDAAHIVSVEGLKPGSELNAIQQCMVDAQGTQCGFCTPGFVVSLQSLMDDRQPIDAHAVRRHLTGNLCRCTGYDSIIKAALKTDPQTVTPLNELYPPAAMLDELREAADQPVTLTLDTMRLFKPATVTQALDFLHENSDGDAGPVILAGGTDLGVLQNKGRASIELALCTAGLCELQGIETDGHNLNIGAGASLSELERVTQQHLPELSEFLGWFGSPLIRNAGTIAGNICTASPIGDLPPALYVMQAQIELASKNETRSVPIEDFQTGYRTTQRRPDELVTAVKLPLLGEDEHLRLYKISKRKDLDISSFSAAFWFRLDGNTIDDIRIAYGGVGPRVMRLPEVEKILSGQPINAVRFEEAARVAASAVTPMSDVRGSETYRRQLAGNAILKLWHELEDGRFNGHRGNGNNNGSPPSPQPFTPLTQAQT